MAGSSPATGIVGGVGVARNSGFAQPDIRGSRPDMMGACRSGPCCRPGKDHRLGVRLNPPCNFRSGRGRLSPNAPRFTPGVAARSSGSSGRSAPLPRSYRPGCRQRAGCSDSARRYRAACTGSSSPWRRRRRRNAPAKVAPEVMSTKIPSFCASSRLQRIASALAMRRMRSMTPVSTASPVSFGMKSGLQPCIGCGFQTACAEAGEPSSLRCCGVPLVSIGASSGSQTTILVSGRSLASTRAIPLRVPPVPNPVTQ